MSDCLIFASLFATYGVLGGNYAAGPAPKDIFELPIVAINTTMLLLSSITYGFAMLAMERNKVSATLGWLVVTALFGAAFVGIELHEFAGLIHEGATPQRSAFLSSFFTLVGTHGLHVTSGSSGWSLDGAGRQQGPRRRPTSAGSSASACSGTSSTSSGSASSPLSIFSECCDEP